MGDTLVCKNRGDQPHTTTSGRDGESQVFNGVRWDSKVLFTGDTFARTFTSPGSFPYTCLIHPSMNAKVTVNQ